jgi:putative transposase
MWTLPEGDADFSGRWWDVKVRFSKSLPNVKSTRPEPPARDGRDIWQKRFWEHTIRDGLSRSHGLRAF